MGTRGVIPDHTIFSDKRRIKEDRICQTEGCTVRLSGYNKDSHCFVHKRKIFLDKECAIR